MEMTMEAEVEVTIKAKVRFTPVKAEPDDINEFDGGTPGHPAYIEDLEVVSILTDRIKVPHEHKDGLLVREERETLLDVRYGQLSLDNEINFAILGAQSDEEWKEQCLEHANEMSQPEE